VSSTESTLGLEPAVLWQGCAPPSAARCAEKLSACVCYVIRLGGIAIVNSRPFLSCLRAYTETGHTTRCSHAAAVTLLPAACCVNRREIHSETATSLHAQGGARVEQDVLTIRSQHTTLNSCRRYHDTHRVDEGVAVCSRARAAVGPVMLLSARLERGHAFKRN
jgi:hypothetical protein